MRWFCFVSFWMFVFLGKCYASDYYFHFNTGTPLVLSNNEIEVQMEYNLVDYLESDFKVKPISEEAEIEIYDYENSFWISSKSNWTHMPSLRQTMKIRINTIEQPVFNLEFQLLDLKTGNIHKTPKQKLWNIYSYFDYIARLNHTLSIMVK